MAWHFEVEDTGPGIPGDAREALEILLKSRPQIVFRDMRMPGFDGENVARLAMAAELHSATVLKVCLAEMEILGPAGERVAGHLRTFLASYDMKAIQHLVAQIPVA